MMTIMMIINDNDNNDNTNNSDNNDNVMTGLYEPVMRFQAITGSQRYLLAIFLSQKAFFFQIYMFSSKII